MQNPLPHGGRGRGKKGGESSGRGNGKGKGANKPCYRCGGTWDPPGHKPEDCRAKNTTCNYCKKVGHLEVACITKKKAEAAAAKNSNPNTNQSQGLNNSMQKQLLSTISEAIDRKFTSLQAESSQDEQALLHEEGPPAPHGFKQRVQFNDDQMLCIMCEGEDKETHEGLPMDFGPMCEPHPTACSNPKPRTMRKWVLAFIALMMVTTMAALWTSKETQGSTPTPSTDLMLAQIDDSETRVAAPPNTTRFLWDSGATSSFQSNPCGLTNTRKLTGSFLNGVGEGTFKVPSVGHRAANISGEKTPIPMKVCPALQNTAHPHVLSHAALLDLGWRMPPCCLARRGNKVLSRNQHERVPVSKKFPGLSFTLTASAMAWAAPSLSPNLKVPLKGTKLAGPSSLPSMLLQIQS